MEAVLGGSVFPLPASYKEALERLEQSKVIVFAHLLIRLYAENWQKEQMAAAGNVALF